MPRTGNTVRKLTSKAIEKTEKTHFFSYNYQMVTPTAGSADWSVLAVRALLSDSNKSHCAALSGETVGKLDVIFYGDVDRAVPKTIEL
jgi:hypothetical protein